MEMQFGIAIIGAIQAVVVAIIGGLFAHDSAKRKKMLEDAETRAALRAEESRLSMKLMSADIDLSIATAIAVRDGKTNGRMESALSNAEKTGTEYNSFIGTVASREISK